MDKDSGQGRHPFAVHVRVGFERVYFIAASDAADAVAQVEAFPGFRDRLTALAESPADFASFETIRGRKAVEMSPISNERDFIQVFGEMFPEPPVAGLED